MRRRVLPTVCTFRCLVAAAASADGECDRTVLAEEAAWIANVADLAPTVHQRGPHAEPARKWSLARRRARGGAERAADPCGQVE